MTTQIIWANLRGKETTLEGDETTPDLEEWTYLSAGITASLPLMSGRNNLICHIRPGAANDGIACFYHPTATMYINGKLLGKEDSAVAPGDVDPTHLDERDNIPVTWGVATHEAAHSRFTLWTGVLHERIEANDGQLPEGIKSQWADAAILLEEPRIEGRQLQVRPQDRKWLRASSTRLVLNEGGAPTTLGGWAKVAVLLLGRADVGVLDKEDVDNFEVALHWWFTDETIAKMREIFRSLLDVADDDADAMLDLGRRWCELLKDDAGTNGEIDELLGLILKKLGLPLPGGGESVIELPPEAVTAVEETAEQIDRRDHPPLRDNDAEMQAEADEKKEADTASKIFSRGAGVGGPANFKAIQRYRSPTAKEEGGAARLATALQRIMVRERRVIPHTSMLPPGRLNMRQAIALEAQMAMGMMPTVEPFNAKLRRADPRPPFRAGIAADVSSSESGYVGPIAVASWTVARAVNLIPDSEAALVTFNNKARPVLWPRKTPPGVPVLNAAGGTTAPAAAIKALEGKLSLARPGFARLLVLVSDGEYDEFRAARVVAIITRLMASGCKVLWLQSGWGSLVIPGVVPVDVTGDPGNIANVITEAVLTTMKGTQ